MATKTCLMHFRRSFLQDRLRRTQSQGNGDYRRVGDKARGPYAGAVGYFAYNGHCDFAIAIRSIFIDGNDGFVQSGAGIVSDSIAENEFKEIAHKTGAMIQALRDASE